VGGTKTRPGQRRRGHRGLAGDRTAHGGGGNLRACPLGGRQGQGGYFAQLSRAREPRVCQVGAWVLG
jgi:hypothetical protein